MGASIVTGFTQHASRAELEMQALEHEDWQTISSKPGGYRTLHRKLNVLETLNKKRPDGPQLRANNLVIERGKKGTELTAGRVETSSTGEAATVKRVSGV